MNIVEATKSYESWLSGKTPLLKPDLKLKHSEMRRAQFPFLRATYYRWAQLWPKVCPEAARDPVVLAIGDLHVENFGTWRDADGRLVWGINDFDECYPLPFSNDLVRLATSAWIAKDAGEMSTTPDAAVAAILEGYRACAAAGGKPLVLADTSTPLRDMARERLNHPEKFWDKMRSFPPVNGPVPPEAAHTIQQLLPGRDISLQFLHRIAGLGSLGKPRYTAIGNWQGGLIVREAKALSPSACYWAEGKRDYGMIHYDRLLRSAVRCADPFAVVRGPWLGRRLSPDCFKITLSHLPKKRNELDLLHAMGWETANTHLGSAKPAKLTEHLKSKPRAWLRAAAKAMRDVTVSDWSTWRRKSKA